MLCCLDPSRQIDVAAVPKAGEHDDADRVTLARVGLGEEEYVISPNANLKTAVNSKFGSNYSVTNLVMTDHCCSIL